MNDEQRTNRYAELQQQWHGWGSPVGAGIGLLCLGGFIALLAYAGSRFV